MERWKKGKLFLTNSNNKHIYFVKLEYSLSGKKINAEICAHFSAFFTLTF